MEELIKHYQDRLKSVRERKNIVTSQFLKDDLSAKERCYKKFIKELKEELNKLPTEYQLNQSAFEYDKSAHSGHYAGEDPSYHYKAGAEHIIFQIKKEL